MLIITYCIYSSFSLFIFFSFFIFFFFSFFFFFISPSLYYISRQSTISGEEEFAEALNWDEIQELLA